MSSRKEQVRSETSELRKGKPAAPSGASDFSVPTSHFLVPRLRFPAFRTGPAWVQKPLSDLTDPVTERVGDSDCIPFTVTTGEGLVSQEDKYGRTIAGKSLKTYYRLKRDDFAFNKSATKLYPQGYIARFQGDERAAVPNSIFTCFRIADESLDSAYLDYLFQGNLHGRWLKDFITVGARAHGALNISDDDLFALPVPLPAGDETLAEQRKIADCLGSLDDLISAEGQKLEALRDHKKGLMQQLFPSENLEVRNEEGSAASASNSQLSLHNSKFIPRLRFPEFRDSEGWQTPQLASLYRFKRTNSLSRDQLNYEAGTIKNIHYGDIHTKFRTIFRLNDECVPYVNPKMTDNPFDDGALCEEGDIVLADASEDLDDVGKAIEIVSLDGQPVVAGTHTILASRRGDEPVVGFGGYLFQSAAVRAGIKKEAQGAKVYGISAKRISAISVPLPRTHAEQQRIADCLNALDDQIAAQTEKLDALRTHKRGLMQQLFPAPEADGR
jgi:type I restriction enzyme, S subunit